jgi:hypothetical protein
MGKIRPGTAAARLVQSGFLAPVEVLREAVACGSGVHRSQFIRRRKNQGVISIRNKRELAVALSQPRAFVFLWINWAGQARDSQLIVRKVVESWHTEYPDQAVPCYIVDVSDQCGEVWDALLEWLIAENCPAGQLDDVRRWSFAVGAFWPRGPARASPSVWVC